LHDEAAKGVPDQYRRFELPSNDRLVTRDDFRYPDLGQPGIGIR
jgi:hypothetical protein